MRIEFGLGMGRNERIDEVAELARVADECGFSHISYVDQQNISRDVYSMMTIAALNTRRIKIAHGVTVPHTRHPSVTANATATVDELSGGRAILGIGSGGNALRSMGMKEGHPLKRFRELIEFFRKYMSGEEAEFDGARMQSEWVRRPVPIYMAAEGPKALQLAGEIGDGVIILGGPPEWLKWKVELVYRGAENAGRDPTKLEIWVRCMVIVAASKEAAFREATGVNHFRLKYLEMHDKYPVVEDMMKRMEAEQPGLLAEMKQYEEAFDEDWFEHIDAPQAKATTQRMVDNFSLTGTPDDICEGIESLREAGVTTISALFHTISDKKGMLREISDKVMPAFRN